MDEPSWAEFWTLSWMFHDETIMDVSWFCSYMFIVPLSCPCFCRGILIEWQPSRLDFPPQESLGSDPQSNLSGMCVWFVQSDTDTIWHWNMKQYMENDPQMVATIWNDVECNSRFASSFSPYWQHLLQEVSWAVWMWGSRRGPLQRLRRSSKTSSIYEAFLTELTR